MFDIKAIRENPDYFDGGWARRGLPAQTSSILALDEQWRQAQTALQQLQQKRNDASKQIGQAKAQKDEVRAESLMQEVAALKDEMKILEDKADEIGQQLDALLATLPNIPDVDLPKGSEEDDNLEIRRWGDENKKEGGKEHIEIGESLGLLDFEQAAKVSGARFVYLMGALARLERALAQFMLDTHTGEFGYTEFSVPLMVRDAAVFGTGQLPKFSEDLFKTTDDRWLIPTSEVSLTNFVYDKILSEDELPLRVTAFTPCFRSEAGAAGKDTKGMIRQHQFYKVELVSITKPEQSYEELERMTNCAETILKRLELPYRTVLKCIGDTGFTAVRSYDIEVWLPGQKRYREISSCSNCLDFQARRLKARYKTHNGKDIHPVHTLNGSGLAVGRTLIAIMENYQQADGSIAIPVVLQPYMGGLKAIQAPSVAARQAVGG